MKALSILSALSNGFINLLKKEGLAIAAALLLMSLLTAVAGVAAPRISNSSTVEIRMWDNSEFVILFNNKSYGNRTNIILNNVVTGRHQVKIYKRVYERQSRQHRMHLILDDVIVVNARQKLSYIVSRDNQLHLMRTQRPVRPQHLEHRPAPITQLPYCEETYYSGPAVMSAEDFSILQQMVSNTSFEETRLALIKQAIGSRAVSTQQVLSLMNMMSFESTRLELAKWAYSKTIDRENYFIVNQGFSFSSSTSDLANFIAQQ